MTKVYVVEQGSYSDKHVVGVYDSVEGAMSAFPEEYICTSFFWRGESRRRWQLSSDSEDWDEELTITAFDLGTDGPVVRDSKITLKERDPVTGKYTWRAITAEEAVQVMGVVDK